MKKKIIILTQHYFPDIGGITTWCHEIAKQFVKAGEDIVLITKSYDGFSGQEGVVNMENDIPVIRLNHQNWINKRNKKIYSAIKQYISDDSIFLCANWKMAFPCYLHNIFGKCSYYTAVHGLDAMESRKINRLLQVKTFKKSSGIIAVSNYTAGLLNDINLKTNIKVINNGVDINKFSQEARKPEIEKKYGFRDGTRVLSLGRLIPRKGFDTTIKALALLMNKNIHYYIAGKGPYEKRLRALADEYKVSDRVHFLGFIPDEEIVSLYNCADIFSMPCRQLPGDVEGFGITYIEAAACGVPSIAGRNSGAEDAVLQEKTGLLVNPDNVEDTAKALEALINDEAKRHEMGRNARQRVVKELAWDKVALDILNYIKS